MNPQSSTPQSVIILILVALIITLWGGVTAVVYLIVIKAEPALIAIVSGFAGTALGQLGGMLNNTRTSPGSPATTTNTVQTSTQTTP